MESSPSMKPQFLIKKNTNDFESDLSNDISNNDDDDNSLNFDGNEPIKVPNYDLETERWVEHTDINTITLECMMNKKHYKTYLEKTNPTQLKNSVNLQRKILTHSFLIESMFDYLLENSKNNIKGQTSNYNNDIQRAFNNFVQHVIQYIEETADVNIEPTPETVADEQLKKDYGEFDPESKIKKRPDFFTPSPLKKYSNNSSTNIYKTPNQRKR